MHMDSRNARSAECRIEVRGMFRFALDWARTVDEFLVLSSQGVLAAHGQLAARATPS